MPSGSSGLPRAGLGADVRGTGAQARGSEGAEGVHVDYALTRKAGLLAVASGGTVFLDEVGELALDAQAMLLRFLQSGEGRAVGATATLRIDIRIIAATHRDLLMAGRERAFREDLHYRLRRAVLKVPPLRERRDDIPPLVEHFRRRMNERYGLSVPGVTREAMALLEDYHWPGNVRELEAVIEQAMIFRTGEWVGPGDLGLPTEAGEELPAVEAAAPPPPDDERLRLALRREAALRIAEGPSPDGGSRASAAFRASWPGSGSSAGSPRVAARGTYCRELLVRVSTFGYTSWSRQSTSDGARNRQTIDNHRRDTSDPPARSAPDKAVVSRRSVGYRPPGTRVAPGEVDHDRRRGHEMKGDEREQGARDIAREEQGDADELLTLDEVAALLKLPKSWIYERTRRKLIPHVKLGKYLRFSRAALSKWIHGGTDGEASPAPEQPSRAGRGRPLRPLPQSRRP